MKITKTRGIMRVAIPLTIVACALSFTLPAWTQAPDTAAPATGISALLQLKPDAAQIAVGVPAGNALLAKILAFLPRVLPPDMNVQEEYGMLIGDWGFEVGADNAKTIEDLAQAKGLTLDRPAAIFADVTPTAASVKTMLSKAAEAGNTAAPGSLSYGDLAMPALALALGVSDQAKAQAAVDGLAAQMGDSKTEEKAGDITIANYGDLSYFFLDGMLFAGATPLVQGIAARHAAPLAVRYGTDACPIEVADEISILAYGNGLAPILRDLLTALPLPDASKAIVQAQLGMLDVLTTGAPEDDPMVMTLSLTDEAITLASRVDTATHPQLLPMMGTPEPLRTAQYLPNDTQLSLALNLTKEYKDAISKTYFDGLPAEMKAEMGPQLGMAQGIFKLLSKEITLGVTSMQEDFPAILIAIEFEQPEMVQNMLTMFLPVNPKEAVVYKEVTLNPIALPVDIFTPYLAFLGKNLLLASDLDKAKQFIDAAKDGQPSGYFAGLKPPIDPSVQRYKLFSLQISLIKDIALPLAAFATEVPPALMDTLGSLDKIFTELRASSALTGTWMDSRVNLFLVKK